MNRAATTALALLALPLAAPAKDLIGVFEDALHNAPVIRQADANRLAARESKPQALAALLPQLNGTAGWTRDHNSGIQTQIFAALTRGSMTVSNRLRVVTESSDVRRTSRASITGASPTTTNIRPPTSSMRSKRAS